nr:MAG TPA: hypothetical protein [Caudoviricetes sp.]
MANCTASLDSSRPKKNWGVDIDCLRSNIYRINHDNSPSINKEGELSPTLESIGNGQSRTVLFLMCFSSCNHSRCKHHNHSSQCRDCR